MTQIEADNYIRAVIARHPSTSGFVAQDKINELTPHIHAWANGYKYEIKLSGSLAKDTGISGTTDIDLFISLDPSVKEGNTYENVYCTLRNRMSEAGYSVREQNVSLGIDHTGLKVDLVAGVRQNLLGTDHSIWKRKKAIWTKTNIDSHINLVKNSGRTQDIKAVKIWRKQKGLDFPSFYLELSVIEALKGTGILFSSPSKNFVKVMKYLADDFENKVIIDPSNTANQVSEELTNEEKKKIKNCAMATLEGSWGEAIS